MTNKLKIFRIANYFLTILVLLFWGWIIIGFRDRNQTRFDYFMLLIWSVYFASVLFNSLINIHILKKYYPDNLLPKKLKIVRNIAVFFFITGVLFILVLLAGKFLSGDTFERSDYILTVISLAILISSVYILVVQAGLNRLLRINNMQKMKSLISSIGQEE